MPVVAGEANLNITTGGQVDRIDNLRGITRIVDYKTGSVADSISLIEDLFTEDRKKEADAWLQTLLYCEAWQVNNPGTIVMPSVYKIRKMGRVIIDDSLKLKTDRTNEVSVTDYSAIRTEFMEGLNGIVKTIFSSQEPFTMTSDAWGKCGYCPYKGLCLR